MIAIRAPLLPLSQLDSETIAGSKAFNLGRMARLGVVTPGGAVIPDTAFQEHLQHAGVLTDIAALHATPQTASLAQLESAAAGIRRKITQTALSSALRVVLQELLQSLECDQRLAVRSSASGEDSATSSFAGQLDSFLDIRSSAGLEAAVRDTWASLYAPRVLLYSRHKGMALRHMGVIVQPQVAARLSGVLFTRDPTGRHAGSMLLEYATGLGERLVSGAITPGRLRIDRNTLVLTEDVVAADWPPLDTGAQAALRQIAAIGLRLEKDYGVSLDIEWCVDDEDTPVIVQARPATQAAAPRRQHWSNANIAENFPQPVSPFLFSIVRPGYGAYFRNLGLGFGLSARRILAMSDAFDNIVGLQGGRLYYNLSNIHALIRMMPAGARLSEFFNLFVGADDIPQADPVRLGRLAGAVETLRIAVSVVWQYLFVTRRIRRFERRVDVFAANTQPSGLAERSVAELAANIRGFLTIRLQQWNDAALADTAAMVCYGALQTGLARWLQLVDHSALHNDLLKGLPGLASAIPVTKLWELSRRITDDAELKQLFLGNATAEIRRRIAEPQFAAFAAAFAEYLEHWGFRSSAELMLTFPTPVEDPQPLLELLRAYVRSDTQSPTTRAAVQAQARIATTEEVAARLSPVRGWRLLPLVSTASRFRLLLAATQGAIRLRERARMKQALLYTRLRHITLQLGARLVERGVLAQRDDIFMLPVNEVLELAAGISAVPQDLPARLQARREELRAWSTLQPPDRLALAKGETWRPTSVPAAANVAVAQTLRGIGACGGSALGDAAVVLDVAQAGEVQSGQILVTRQTDPGWATVFFLVRGLVIERGGMLSHGAIIAREYGIPAVVGVTDATRVIRNGDSLRVDGDQGLVEFCH